MRRKGAPISFQRVIWDSDHGCLARVAKPTKQSAFVPKPKDFECSESLSRSHDGLERQSNFLRWITRLRASKKARSLYVASALGISGDLGQSATQQLRLVS